MASKSKSKPRVAGPRSDPDGGRPVFSFRHLQPRHSKFDIGNRDPKYLLKLMERLKAACQIPVSELTATKSRSWRFHQIHFEEKRVSEDGFGGAKENDERAFQFEVSQSAHGRVHGFLVGYTFYVVWLDPDHNLYPRDR